MSTGVWTNNWRGLRNAMLMGVYKTDLSTVRLSNGALPADSTAASAGVGGNSPLALLHYDDRVLANVIWFGDGDATPLASDYQLGHQISLTILSATNESLTFDTQAGAATRVVKVAVSNPGNTDSVTLREWGLFTRALGGQVLTYHALLDNPVVLQPHQSAVLTLTLSMTLSDPL